MHVALIPDGNRRWARERGLPPWKGHLEGAKNFERILKKALELNIDCLTFWGCSIDNLTKREKREVNFLLKIFGNYFKRLLKEKIVDKERVKINFFGRWQKYFPQEIKETIKKLIKKTKNYEKRLFNLLMAYDGKDEMKECIKKIVKKGIKKIDEKTILENLWTGKLPPVDLVIRTGIENDPHNSAGFMMWQTAYAQYYFTKTYFPAFSPEEFEGAIKDFLKRERRFGK